MTRAMSSEKPYGHMSTHRDYDPGVSRCHGARFYYGTAMLCRSNRTISCERPRHPVPNRCDMARSLTHLTLNFVSSAQLRYVEIFIERYFNTASWLVA